MAARAFCRFGHQNPLDRFFADFEGNRAPTDAIHAIGVFLQAASAKIRPRIVWRLRDSAANFLVRDEPLDLPLPLQQIIQAFVRANVVILQIHHAQARIIPAALMLFAIILQQFQFNRPV